MTPAFLLSMTFSLLCDCKPETKELKENPSNPSELTEDQNRMWTATNNIENKPNVDKSDFFSMILRFQDLKFMAFENRRNVKIKQIS